MRIDKLMEKVGSGSRQQVKRLLQTRQVRVDGDIVTNGRTNVDAQLQRITVANQRIQDPGECYLLLNKPKGVVSAVSDLKHKTVLDLLSEVDCKEGLYPIGRLDRDTEGLLLLTTNGPLGYRMLHPKHHVTKTYRVEVNGDLADDALEFFQSGIRFLDGTVCQPASLEILEASPNWSCATLTIKEGKFHQVKKMFLAYGVKVTALKRIAFGPFQLENDLPVGAYRTLTPKEKSYLKAYLD